MSKTYSFLDVACSIVGPGGAFSLGAGSGNAEEGITFTPTGELNTMQIGADGSGQHSLSADKSGTITIRLLKTSPVNAQLSQMQAFQRESSAAHGQNTITLNDTQRGDSVSATQVAFAKVPDLTYAKVAGFNEWTFHAVRIDMTLGV